MSDHDPQHRPIERLLDDAFRAHSAAAGTPSLVDVRHRARRRQRRRAGAVVGAAAVVGIGGAGVLSRRGDGATTASPGDGGATSTTFQICWSPQLEYPTTTIITDGTWPADGATTTVAPTTAADTIAVEATSTIAAWPTSLPTDCLPTGQYRCLGNSGTDDQGYTYFEYCETWAGGTVATTTTSVVGSFVVVVDASGIAGAADDAANLLSSSGFGTVQVLTATRPVAQTMLTPLGDTGGLEILQQLTGIDGFDTWTPDLIDGELPAGTGVVVIVGADYWARNVGTTTMPAATTTTSAG
jgi:hypothetical protein